MTSPSEAVRAYRCSALVPLMAAGVLPFPGALANQVVPHLRSEIVRRACVRGRGRRATIDASRPIFPIPTLFRDLAIAHQLEAAPLMSPTSRSPLRRRKFPRPVRRGDRAPESATEIPHRWNFWPRRRPPAPKATRTTVPVLRSLASLPAQAPARRFGSPSTCWIREPLSADGARNRPGSRACQPGQPRSQRPACRQEATGSQGSRKDSPSNRRRWIRPLHDTPAPALI